MSSCSTFFLGTKGIWAWRAAVQIASASLPSFDDATRLFMKECGSPEPEAHREAYRGTSDPGYINYTVGKLEILKLRDDYRAKMGDKFSLTDFHDRLLAGGLAPLKIIRREMMGVDGCAQRAPRRPESVKGPGGRSTRPDDTRPAGQAFLTEMSQSCRGVRIRLDFCRKGRIASTHYS